MDAWLTGVEGQADQTYGHILLDVGEGSHQKTGVGGLLFSRNITKILKVVYDRFVSSPEKKVMAFKFACANLRNLGFMLLPQGNFAAI